jgi:hypothetical protein
VSERDLLAEIEALRTELATQQRAIPTLPDADGLTSIRWKPWRVPPTILDHVDLACDECAHPGPQLIAFGLTGSNRPVITHQAHRCPACQEMRVYRRDRPKYGLMGVQLTQIAYSPPVSVPAGEKP